MTMVVANSHDLSPAGDRYRWHLWRRVFAFDILPLRSRLDPALNALEALGTRFLLLEARPRLASEFPDLFDATATGAALQARLSVQRVAAFSFRLAEELSAIHGGVPGAAGPVAAWMGVAGSIVDHLLDEHVVPAAALAARLSPDQIRAALPLDGNAHGDHHGRPPHRFDDESAPAALRFLLVALELAFAGARALLARSPSSRKDRIRHELLACLCSMAAAELRSPRWRLAAPLERSAVERELEEVNTLSVWVSAYLGLLTHEPAPAALETLLRTTRAVGRLGWLLDALSDAHADLEAGVWSLVWLRVAAELGTGWIGEGGPRRDVAAEALDSSSVVDQLLSEVELILRGIETDPDLPVRSRAELGLLCRTTAFSFLRPRCEEPADMQEER